MVWFVQVMTEVEEPPLPTYGSIMGKSLEERVLETSMAVLKSFNQAHELIRFVLDRVAKQEDVPQIEDAYRFLRFWHFCALQTMELVGNTVRAACVDTCAHDAALRFAGAVYGSLGMASEMQDVDYLHRLQLPDKTAMNDRLNVEKARALDRVRASTQRNVATVAPLNSSRVPPNIVVSPDGRSANWFGLRFEFTPTQAECVLLWKSALDQGTPFIGDGYVIENTELQHSTSPRLDLTFRDNEAWGKMIITGKTKGTHGLNDQPSEEFRKLLT